MVLGPGDLVHSMDELLTGGSLVTDGRVTQIFRKRKNEK
jgi:hypothetical protein